MASIKQIERRLGEIEGAQNIRSKLVEARGALKGDAPDRPTSLALLAAARTLHATDVAWRNRAAERLRTGLDTYREAIRDSIGLRSQARLSPEQAEEIASCQAVHRDVSLQF